MRLARQYRCPCCSLEIGALDGGPLLEGALIVCAGCRSPLTIDRGRLGPLEPGALPTELAERVLAEQRAIVEKRGGRLLPVGYEWRRAPVCRSCWHHEGYGDEPRVTASEAFAPCALCGTVTGSGLYRRMLVRER